MRLEHYEQIYDIMEYAAKLSQYFGFIQSKIARNNPANPTNLWRYSGFSSIEMIKDEMETCTQAYYDLIDDMGEHKEWIAKIEDELG